jgi:hypothetical protein
MPSLNEFFKKEKLLGPELEKFNGAKPCAECNKDSDSYYWDSVEFTLSWTCPDGHKNSFRINK